MNEEEQEAASAILSTICDSDTDIESTVQLCDAYKTLMEAVNFRLHTVSKES